MDYDPVAPVDRNGLESLPADECLNLLGHTAMGRVGVTWDVLPVILPVNYVLDGERIIIRTAPGTKLSAALSRTVVAFEIDGFDPLTHGGWSVLVRGSAREIADPDEIERLERLPLRPWANEDADRFVAIEIELLSGRRVPRDPLEHPAGVHSSDGRIPRVDELGDPVAPADPGWDGEPAQEGLAGGDRQERP